MQCASRKLEEKIGKLGKITISRFLQLRFRLAVKTLQLLWKWLFDLQESKLSTKIAVQNMMVVVPLLAFEDAENCLGRLQKNHMVVAWEQWSIAVEGWRRNLSICFLHFYFSKYGTEQVNAALCGVSEKPFRTWCWKFIHVIAFERGMKITNIDKILNH